MTPFPSLTVLATFLTLTFGAWPIYANDAGQRQLSFVDQPCTPQESWTWAAQDSENGASWIHEFEAFLLGKTSQVRSFSEALAFRKASTRPEQQALAEYWLSRTLLSAGLIHLAHQGFHALIARELRPATAPYQLAALGCLNVVRSKHSALSLEANAIKQITALNHASRDMYPAPSPYQSILQETNFHLAREHFNSDISTLSLKLLADTTSKLSSEPNSKLPKDVNSPGNSNFYEILAKAYINFSQNDSKEGIKQLEQFFSNPNKPNLSPLLLDETHLLYGRALFEAGRYAEAIQQYKSISTRSNEWVHALAELSWTYLMAERYQESIGAGIALQSGNLKKTFAPEALMVMSIALNEICRFPESMSMIEAFRKSYHSAYLWLKSHTAEANTPKFYKLAVALLKKSASLDTPPINVGSEWLRSPVFLANQERLNLLIRENKLTDQLSELGRSEQHTTALNLIKKAKDIRKKLNIAKIKLKPGELIPEKLLAEIKLLREDRIHFQRLKNAGAVWRIVLTHYQESVPITQSKLTTIISKEIARLNQRMLTQLEEIAENNELIEVEIYNAASEDMIWQNAHQDYKEIAKMLKQKSRSEQAEKVWDWGSTHSGLDGRGETWEDEQGSGSADLPDNCDNKDKYLALKSTPKKL